MGIRRKAREAALQLLYEIDLSGKDFQQVLHCHDCASLLASNSPELSEEELQQREAFCCTVVEGVAANVREIDQLIESHSTHWKISRMALVDRNILRIAVFEFLYCKDIPPLVSVNEAIDIAKRFGTEESGSFINGVLDHIVKDLKKV